MKIGKFLIVAASGLLLLSYNNCSQDVGFGNSPVSTRGSSSSEDVGRESHVGDNRLNDLHLEENSEAHAMFRTRHEAELYMRVTEPPTPERILATWARSTDGHFFHDPTEAVGGNVQQWYYDNVRDSFVMPINSPSLEQIYSPTKLDRYVFEATLTSNDRDDDWIGLIAAAEEVDGRMISLLVGVQSGGGQMRYHPNREHYNFSMVLIDENTEFPSNHHTYATLIDGNNSIRGNSSPNNNNQKHGWNGRRVRLQVVRDGTQVTARITDWDGTEFMPESTLTADLSALPGKAAALAKPARYGFASLSQRDSTYLNYSIRSHLAFDLTRIFSAEENLFWRFVGDDWQLQEQSASDYLLPLQSVYNPLTKDHFVPANERFNLLRQSGIPHGEVTLSLPKNSTTNLEFDHILAAFPYDKPLSIESVFLDENLMSELVAGRLRVVTGDTNGSFYLYIKSKRAEESMGSVEATIGFRKVNIIVQ